MKVWQNNGFMTDLLRRVRSGDMAPAAFQRPYVWTKDDVLALCESVIRGYPLGSFLSWIPEEGAQLSEVAKPRLGPIEARSIRPYQTALLLDGQNRLATLGWMMRVDPEPVPQDLTGIEKETWGSDEALVLNLESRAFEWVPHAQADDGMRIPSWAACGIAMETSRLKRAKWNQWEAAGVANIEDAMRFHDDVNNSFREARVTETVLENASVDEARQAFRHICRVGVPISADDFDAAIGFTRPSSTRRPAL